jgi:hypothetical protein
MRTSSQMLLTFLCECLLADCVSHCRSRPMCAGCCAGWQRVIVTGLGGRLGARFRLACRDLFTTFCAPSCLRSQRRRQLPN